MTLVIIVVWPTASSAQEPSNKLMQLIKARGKLVVGVKTDYPPWGGIDENAQKVGLEPDLAHDLAQRLGVGLDLVGVTTANRLDKVNDGSIDLVIATMGDSVKRRNIAGLLEPNYYASGVNILVHKGIKLRDWGEVRGREVCLTEGAYFNRDLIQRYLIEPVIYKGTRDTQLALEAARCIGWAYDDTALAPMLNEERWRDFGIPINSIMIVPWSMAVSKTEENGTFAHFVEDTIAEWHRTGFLLEREAAWKIPQSQFLTEQNELFNKRDENGELLCRRNDEGIYPIICRNQKIAKETGEADNLPAGSMRSVLVEMGFDFLFIKDPFVTKSLLHGALLTIGLSIACMIGSLVFGVVMATLSARSSKFVQVIIASVNNLFRMTPPIINLYIIFFGIGAFVTAKWGVSLNATVVAIVVFSLYAGASNAAIITKALDSVQGKTGSQKSSNLPMAISASFTGLVANSVNIVKAVGIASVIAVPEVISVSNRILSENGNSLEMMNFMVVFYFCVVGIFLLILRGLHKKVKKWALAKS